MKKIAFFDLNIIGISRYPLQIAKEIQKENKQVKFYFLYEEDPNNKLNEIKQLLPKNSEVIKIHKPNYKYIKKLLRDINPNKLLVMAQRIPDNAIVAVANELGIKTFKFQHGLYIPFMKRNISMFFEKIKKTIRYMQYAMVVAEATNISKITSIKEYIDVFIKGKKITQTSLPLNKINSQTVFVYGEYWKQYHKEQFGYNYDQQIIVGYPDLINLDEVRKQPQEDAICYICQTLVEDGRLPRKQMIDFIDILANGIRNKKLYIKLHPRSDLSLYNKLKNNSNVIFVNEDFPNCKKYIGHYSSLIAIALYLTDEVFLWKFENHNEYPFYFVENSILSNSIEEFKIFLNSKLKNNKNNKTNNIKYYFDLKNTFEEIIKEL